MSVTHSDPTKGAVVHTAAGRACFYCGEPLKDPAVYWMGATAEIYIHSECVSKLFLRLARDVHEVENPLYYVRRLGRAG